LTASFLTEKWKPRREEGKCIQKSTEKKIPQIKGQETPKQLQI